MKGWVFDLWETPKGVFLWLLKREAHGDVDFTVSRDSYLIGGAFFGMTLPYGPVVFATGNESALQRLGEFVLKRGWAARVGFVYRREFWSHDRVRALAIRLRSPTAFDAFRKWVERCRYSDSFPTLYHLDFPVIQHFLLEYGIFPTANIRLTESGRLTTDDARWSTDYHLPPLCTMEMRLARSTIAPPSRENPLLLRCEGYEHEVFASSAEGWLERLESVMHRYDPDVVITAGGDERLLPLFLKMAHRAKRRFPLDRLPPQRSGVRGTRKGRSLVSYGRIYYMSPEFPLYGRWHLDTENTFLFSEADLPGVIELARLSGLPVPFVARSAIGSIMTALQIAEALRQGYLIPPQKQQVEDWKTAEELLRIDKGGLYFRPPVGTFANVAELDFSQMYPSIMVRHNISPETINCSCCSPLKPDGMSISANRNTDRAKQKKNDTARS
ncbi:MAG: DNA polymerase domain-containing protein [bacterium JZ-2024 1]